MNSKKAKALRQAAGYRNQTATPGAMDFPGVARFVKHPRFETHEAVKTCYIQRPGDVKHTKSETKIRKLTLGAGRQPIMAMEANPNYGKPVEGMPGLIDAEQFTPVFDLVPNSKPGRLRATEPKGIYRALKKLARRGLLGAAAKAEEFLDEITGSEQAPA